MEEKKNRSTFSGKIGFVLAAAGASVGLGNIWRFPYLAAKYGGGVFLLIYILLAVTFGYTMIVAESAIGRMTRKSPVGAFKSFGNKKWLSAGGWLNAIIPVLIVPYYSVIGGWVIKYLVEYIKGNGRPIATDNYFNEFIAPSLRNQVLFRKPTFDEVYEMLMNKRSLICEDVFKLNIFEKFYDKIKNTNQIIECFDTEDLKDYFPIKSKIFKALCKNKNLIREYIIKNKLSYLFKGR